MTPTKDEAQPAVQEQLGSVCADGGTCHHQCTERCFRRECCAPFSDYVGPWSYATPPAAPVPLTDGQINKLRQQYGVTSNGRGIKEFTYVVDFARAIEAARGITKGGAA